MLFGNLLQSKFKFLQALSSYYVYDFDFKKCNKPTIVILLFLYVL